MTPTAIVTPQHQHDCDQGCVFLGRLHTADLYYHIRHYGALPSGEYIVRYSSEGSDYACFPDFQNAEYEHQADKWSTPGKGAGERERFLRLMTLFAVSPCALLNLMEHAQ